MPLPDASTPAPMSPRRALAWAALVYAAFTMLLAYPALSGGFLVSSVSDQYIAGFPFREFAAESLRAGKGFPLWNPYQFGGMPYIAAMHGDIFYPTFLLRMVLPTDVAMTWSFVVHIFLAGLFSYLFLRAVNFAFFPALLGGLTYMMSGGISSYVSPGHDGKLYVSALLPLFLWALHRGIRDGKRWAWGAVAIIVGLGVLSPHPQLLQYMLLCGGAYAIYAAFAAGDANADQDKLERPVAIRRLAFAFGAVALGMLMGAIQFLPVLGYVDWSPRAGGAGWEHAISYSFPPEELINTYLPQFSGILEHYWGRNGIHLHSEYLGAAVLILALAGFGRAGGVRRGFVYFWAGTLVISLLWALGGFTPFYHLVYAIVPGTKFFRAPSTIYFIVCFSIAVFAAAGTQRALARKISPRYLGGWVAIGVLTLLLAVGGGFTNLGLALVDPRFAGYVTENQQAVVMGAFRSLLFVVLAAAVLMSERRGTLRASAAGWALVGVVGIDLWTVDREYWRFSPPADELYASDPAIDYLKAQTEPGRVLAVSGPPSAGVTGRDPYFGRAGGLMHHKVRNVLGYHGNEIGRYDILLGADQGMNQLANPNLWQLLNIRFLMTNFPEAPFDGVERLVGPVRNVVGDSVYLFRMPGDNPLAWVTPAIVKAADNAVLATVREPAYDVRSAALFDSSAAVQAQELTRAPDPIDLPVAVVSYAPGQMDFRLSRPAPAGSALMVSENYYPGWTATADGQPAPVGRADFTLIGIALPEGAQEISLRFRSPTYERGKLITLAALALATLLVGAGIVMERRQSV